MRGRAVRSRAHLNALPGQPKKATPLLPALHARADGAAIDAAFDAEAAVLAEWLVSKQELRTPPPLPPCGAQDPARRRAVTGPRRRRAVKHSAAVRSAVNDAGLEQVPRHAPPVALCCALAGQMDSARREPSTRLTAAPPGLRRRVDVDEAVLPGDCDRLLMPVFRQWRQQLGAVGEAPEPGDALTGPVRARPAEPARGLLRQPADQGPGPLHGRQQRRVRTGVLPGA
jgi:hypothetical protein